MKKPSKATRFCVLSGLVTATACLLSWHNPTPTVEQRVTDYYSRCLTDFQQANAQLEAALPAASQKQLQYLFAKSRQRYKKIEWLVEYLYPATALKLNGPALPEAEPSEPEEVMQPSGFQVLEEKLYVDSLGEVLRREAVFNISTITNRIHYLQSQAIEMELNKSIVLDALKLNIYRLIAKGLAGFDTPVSLIALTEIEPTLQSTETVLSFFPASQGVHQRIAAAIKFLQTRLLGFKSFNRGFFITRYLNPITTALADYQLTQRIPVVNMARALRPTAKTLFEATAFDPLFYAPSGTQEATSAQIALGKALFAEPLLSSTGNRSCQSCHQSGKAFSDGLALNTVLGGDGSLLRNTPGLWNAGLQPVQFYDGRISFLEDQVHDVVSSRQEMGGLFDGIVAELEKKDVYKARFKTAFGTTSITADDVRTALAAYVRSLVAMNSRFDRYMRGYVKAITANELAGFILFMGKGKCATCHFLPLFSGTVPPLYDKMESEVLGVPANADTLRPVLDNDSGKYAVYNIPHHLRSFKTPSLRNIALTAPYMHNGVYKTLEEVIDFYDRGGGAGLGFGLPNQTLPPDRLHLTQKEKGQIISFLRSLTDTVVGGTPVVPNKNAPSRGVAKR